MRQRWSGFGLAAKNIDLRGRWEITDKHWDDIMVEVEV